MKEKSDILREVDEALDSKYVFELSNKDILRDNVYKMIEFYNEQDLWNKIVLCDRENVTYFLVYSLFIIAMTYNNEGTVKDPQKFYDFACDWIGKNQDHYITSFDKGFTKDIFEACLLDFAKELDAVIKEDDE